MFVLILAAAENGLRTDIGHYSLTTGSNGRGEPRR